MSVFTNLARRFIVPGSTKSDGLRLAFDLEANALLHTANTVHCIVIADLDGGQVDEYGPEQISCRARASRARRLPDRSQHHRI
jgi:hypothetical protein